MRILVIEDEPQLAGHIVRDFPESYANYYGQRNFSYNNIKQDNRNMLLGRDPMVDGMKTGYTDAAGYCLIASAQRDLPSGKRRGAGQQFERRPVQPHAVEAGVYIQRLANTSRAGAQQAHVSQPATRAHQLQPRRRLHGAYQYRVDGPV